MHCVMIVKGQWLHRERAKSGEREDDNSGSLPRL